MYLIINKLFNYRGLLLIVYMMVISPANSKNKSIDGLNEQSILTNQENVKKSSVNSDKLENVKNSQVVLRE